MKCGVQYIEDNHSNVCHICGKEFLDSNLDSAVIDKN